jgi:hypothetical protein
METLQKSLRQKKVPKAPASQNHPDQLALYAAVKM